MIQLPPLDAFRRHPGPLYGRPWSADPAGADFTLTLPDVGVVLEDDPWKPHEESYQLAQRVVAELDEVKREAIGYLARIVDAGRMGMHDVAYFTAIDCDARAERVTVSLVWETNVYAEWSVTFSWQELEDGRLRRSPQGMSMRQR